MESRGPDAPASGLTGNVALPISCIGEHGEAARIAGAWDDLDSDLLTRDLTPHRARDGEQIHIPAGEEVASDQPVLRPCMKAGVGFGEKKDPGDATVPRKGV